MHINRAPRRRGLYLEKSNVHRVCKIADVAKCTQAAGDAGATLEP